MRLRPYCQLLSRIAQAIASGRFAFYKGIVPLCFTLENEVPAPAGIRIVFDCSSRPFCEKMAKNVQKVKKTMKQFSTGPPHRSKKNDEFLPVFFELFSGSGTLTSEYHSCPAPLAHRIEEQGTLDLALIDCLA
jgi:hypothetical protein